MKKTKQSKIGIVICIAGLSGLTGCVTHVDESPQARVYAPPGYDEPDDYVYYPAYQVYYSPRRRQYFYPEGRSWVARPAPPRVSSEIVFSSPSVRLGFHDSPAHHHAAVVKQYPRRWAPDNNGNHGEREKEVRREERRRD